MPYRDRSEKVQCKECGLSVSKNNFSRHRKRHKLGNYNCQQCPKERFKSQEELLLHESNKHDEVNNTGGLEVLGDLILYRCHLFDKLFITHY